MSLSLFEADDLALANKAVSTKPKKAVPPPAAQPALANPGMHKIETHELAPPKEAIRPDRIVTIKVESAKGINSTFISRFKASEDPREVLEHSEGASRAEGETQTLAEVHALIGVLAQIEQMFPEGLTEVHAVLPRGLGGFAKANLPTYDRMGCLDEDQTRAEAAFMGQMKNPVPEAARPSYRRLAAALKRQPITLNW